MSEINNLKRKLNDYLHTLRDYDKKASKQSQQLVTKINEIKYSSDDLSYLLEIPLLEKQEYSFGLRKKVRLSFNKPDEGKQIVDSINKIVFSINEQNKKNIIAKYRMNESEYLEVKCFIIRKLFIYYMGVLLNSLSKVNNEEVHALKYNVHQEIKEIKDNDNWFLANNLIDEFILKNIMNHLELKSGGEASLEDVKNETVIAMKECDNKLEWIKLMVSLNSVDSIRNDILNNEHVHKMMSKIDNILLDFIDFYVDKDVEFIKKYFNNEEDFKEILAKLGYKYSDISEEDRLDLELCKTLDVDATTEPDKDFCISKIYRQGVIQNNSIIRKALVNVYRFEID